MAGGRNLTETLNLSNLTRVAEDERGIHRIETPNLSPSSAGGAAVSKQTLPEIYPPPPSSGKACVRSKLEMVNQ